MIAPLSEGTPSFEALTVRWGYPIFARALRKLLGLSDQTAAAALAQIRSTAKSVDDRLADRRPYLAVTLAPLVLPDTYGGPLPSFTELPPIRKTLA